MTVKMTLCYLFPVCLSDLQLLIGAPTRLFKS